MSKRKAELTSHVHDMRKKHSVGDSEHSDGASEHKVPDHDDARLQEALHLYDKELSKYSGSSGAGKHAEMPSKEQRSGSCSSERARASEQGDYDDEGTLFQMAIDSSAPEDKTLLSKTLALGRYPQRYMKPSTEEQRKENCLADALSKRMKKMSTDARRFLDELKDARAAADAKKQKHATQQKTQALLAKVRKLGRIPQRFMHPQNAEQTAENALAHDLGKARAGKKLDDAAEAMLDELKARSAAVVAERKRQYIDGLLAEVRRLGRQPLEHARSDDANKEAERKLARNLRHARFWGQLDAAALAELDELAWVDARDREAKADQRSKEVQEDRISSRQAVKQTFAAWKASDLKCSCHDFAHWQSLWRVDSELIFKLRDTGHHLPQLSMPLTDLLLSNITSYMT